MIFSRKAWTQGLFCLQRPDRPIGAVMNFSFTTERGQAHFVLYSTLGFGKHMYANDAMCTYIIRGLTLSIIYQRIYRGWEYLRQSVLSFLQSYVTLFLIRCLRPMTDVRFHVAIRNKAGFGNILKLDWNYCVSVLAASRFPTRWRCAFGISRDVGHCYYIVFTIDFWLHH